MATKAETAFQRKVQSYLKKCGAGRVWKNHGSAYSDAGLPDIMATFEGRLVAIECKTKGQKPTKLQEKFVRDLVADNAAAFFAWTIDDVAEGLRRFGVLTH